MASKGMKALFGWCKTHTEGYKDVSVTNMTTSWKDGLAFCALLHRFRPDLIDFDSLSKENALYNNDLAFGVAEKELNIAALLDAEDMVNMKVPDKLSVMTYLSQYYNCFRNCNPANAPVCETPVLNAESPRRPNVDSVKSSDDESICAICGKHVHLVQRYFEKGKLYHRTCHRNDSLEKLRSKKFFRPPESQEDCEPDSAENEKSSPEKKVKHPRLDPKPSNHPAVPILVETPVANSRHTDPDKTASPKSVDKSAALSVHDDGKAGQPVSPKPRARNISAKKQSTNQTDESKNIVAPHPVATPRSTGNIDATQQVKTEEQPPTVTHKQTYNPFESSGCDSDTTLSSTSSEDEESGENPFMNAPTPRSSGGDAKGIISNKETLENMEKVVHGVTEEHGSDESDGLNPFGEYELPCPEKADASSGEIECKNPFGDVDEHSENEPESLNPFGDYEEEPPPSPPKPKESEKEGNPFGDYEEEKKPPARPPPPKAKLKERVNPFNAEVRESAIHERDAAKTQKKKRPAPVPPKVVSPPPQRPPAWKGSPEKKVLDEINKAAQRKMHEINQANTTDPKFARTQRKKAAPAPPQSKSPGKLEKKNVPPPQKPMSPSKTSVRNPESLMPNKKDKIKPGKQLHSTRSAPGYGYPLIKRKVQRKMSEESIANELQVLDVQLSDLELKGVKLEEMLRFTMDKDMDWTTEEDELLQEWFELVNKKNILLRRETELVFLMQQQKLEEEHADIEFQLRKLFNKPDNSKTDQDKLEEEKLLQRLLEVVESRNVIINSIEEERLKEAEEDSAYEKMKKLQENKNKKKKKNKVKKMFSKRGKKEKQQGEVKNGQPIA